MIPDFQLIMPARDKRPSLSPHVDGAQPGESILWSAECEWLPLFVSHSSNSVQVATLPVYNRASPPRAFNSQGEATAPPGQRNR